MVAAVLTVGMYRIKLTQCGAVAELADAEDLKIYLCRNQQKSLNLPLFLGFPNKRRPKWTFKHRGLLRFYLKNIT
jgi:hypothetical protein